MTEQQSQPAVQTSMQVSKRNRKIGLLWIVGPISGLIVVFILFAVVTFVANIAQGPQADTSADVVMNLINVVLGLVGVVCMLLVPIGIIVGILYMSKKEPVGNAVYDPRSGLGAYTEVPQEIAKKWNWGAAGLTWIWGLFHRVWFSLVIFVPILGLVWWIVLGIKGNTWAWQEQKWVSVEEFEKSQRKWAPWGVVFLLLGIAFTFLFVLFAIAASKMRMEY